MFEKVSVRKPTRDVHNLSHTRMFSMKMGYLIPIFMHDVVPGDDFRINAEALIRMAPMLAPIMHQIDINIDFFHVPYRLIWDDSETFITGGVQGTTEPIMPYVVMNEARKQYVTHGSLLDYLGAPSIKSTDTITGNHNINALPLRAYNLIWNEWFRDQTLQTELTVNKNSGVDANIDMCCLRKRAWRKDLFTSALPWTQRGAEVELPLIGNSPVILADNTDSPIYKGAVSGSPLTLQDVKSDSTGKMELGGVDAQLDPNGTLINDLSSVASATILELRYAVRLQAFLEKLSLGGSRYKEHILAIYGVNSKDSRLDRPEHLGSSRNPMLISEVLQTSSTDGTSPQANMAGHGVSAGETPMFKRFFTEHGLVMGLLSVTPKPVYMQGFNRFFLKDDRFDLLIPDFQHIGEQAVYNSELYHDYSTEIDKDAFGYQSRYYEYKYIPNTVHGEYRDSLLFWHMGRKFDSKPVLNGDFIECNPTNRIFAVSEDVENMYVTVYNKVMAIRPLTRHTTPKLW